MAWQVDIEPIKQTLRDADPPGWDHDTAVTRRDDWVAALRNTWNTTPGTYTLTLSNPDTGESDPPIEVVIE
jgi:hypothetical protein